MAIFDIANNCAIFFSDAICAMYAITISISCAFFAICACFHYLPVYLYRVDRYHHKAASYQTAEVQLKLSRHTGGDQLEQGPINQLIIKSINQTLNLNK